MKKNITHLLLTSLLFASCTMIPKYSRPESPVAKNLSEGDEKELQQDVASIKWQEFFKSPDMQQIIQIALDNNRDLKIASLNVDAVQALYRIERSNLLPSVSAGGLMNKQKISANSNYGNTVTTTTYDASIATAYEIDLFGRIRSGNKAALEAYLSLEEAKKSAQISLIAQVANTYLQFLADQKKWQLSKDTVETSQKSLEIVNNRFKNGIVSSLDVAQAETLIENAKVSQAAYSTQVLQDKNALLLLMGVSSSDLLDKPTKLEDITLMENLPASLKSDVLLTRPDIMQAEHDLKSANANIGAARAAFFPTISLTGSIGYASSDLSNLFSSSSAGWGFTPQISLPIFQGGRNKANLDYAKISKNIYIAKYEKAIQTAFSEVANELAARKNLGDQMQSQINLVKAAENSYKISHNRYKAGLDSFLNELDSKRQLFAAEQNKIDLEKEKLANLVRLYKTLGGGVL